MGFSAWLNCEFRNKGNEFPQKTSFLAISQPLQKKQKIQKNPKFFSLHGQFLKLRLQSSVSTQILIHLNRELQFSVTHVVLFASNRFTSSRSDPVPIVIGKDLSFIFRVDLLYLEQRTIARLYYNPQASESGLS